MFFVAEIDYYEEDSDVIKHVGTFVYEDSLSNAVESIAHYFGEGAIEKITIEPFSPDNLLVFFDNDLSIFFKAKEALAKDILW